MIDGYSGFNQIWMKDEYKYKIAFKTKWGISTFKRILFHLSNVGATFQRTMDHAFGKLINKIIPIYLDDMIVFYKNRSDCLEHLRQVFKKCMEFGISINPKNQFFWSIKENYLATLSQKRD